MKPFKGFSLKQVGTMVGAVIVVGFVSTYFNELEALFKIPDTKK